MKNLQSIILLLLGLFIYSCTSPNTPQESSTPTPTHSTSSVVSAASPKAPDKDSLLLPSFDAPKQLIEDYPNQEGVYRGKGTYLRLKGTVGNTPVTVYLTVFKTILNINEDQPTIQYNGFYYYDKYQEPIPLSSPAVQEGNQIVLYENFWYDLQIEWILNKTGERYFGAWYNIKKQTKVEIDLKVDPPSDELEVHWLSNNRQLITTKSKEKNYAALTQLQMIFPKEKNYQRAKADLKMNMIWRIIPYYASAQQAEWYHSPDTLLNTIYSQFTEMVNMDLQDFNEGDMLSMQHQFEEQFMTVVHQSDKRLALLVERIADPAEYFDHRSKRFINISLPDWEELGLEDILKPGYEETLKRELVKSAKRKFAQFPEFELDYLKAEITDNYAITDKGVWFSYRQGHFNGYDKMEHQVFASFKAMTAYLK